MQIYIKLIILFIFTLTLLILNLPQLSDNDLFKRKIYIFCGLFIFEFVVSVLESFYKKMILNTKQIIKSSLETALLGVISYSLYTDLSDSTTMDMKQNIIISASITGGVTVGYLINKILI